MRDAGGGPAPSAAGRSGTTPLDETFERYLQDKGKGRGGEGGNYRRNAARELERFAAWAAGDRGPDDWTGIVPGDADRVPTFADLNERVFREYARHLAGDRGLKGNTTQTYYRFDSTWVGWCVNGGTSKPTTPSGRARRRPCPTTTAASPATNRTGRPNSATR